MEDLVSIQVRLGDRTYPLKVKAEEETLVREAEHLMNEKFQQFQLKFSGQENQDYVAMSALMLAVELMKKSSGADNQKQDIMNRLNAAIGLVNQGLKER